MSYSPAAGTNVHVKARYEPDHIDPEQTPQYETPQSSGMDLRADIKSPVTLFPGQKTLVPTGLHVDLPRGIEGQVRPRSGLALNYGVTVLNSPGTIDADYQGDIGVILFNPTDPFQDEGYEINVAERIAQLVFTPVVKAELNFVDQFEQKTERGEGGFGSTGRQ